MAGPGAAGSGGTLREGPLDNARYRIRLRRTPSAGKNGPVASKRPVVGVDVGGTKIAAAVVTAGDHAPSVIEHPTDISSGEAVIAGIEAAVREVEPAPAAVGVGVPSQIDFATGRIRSSVNIPLQGVALREELSGRLGAPVFVENDANCAALAEAQLVGVHNLVMLTLGTGVGGGIVIDGAIFRGSTGLGAELGHVTIDADGPACPGNCPNRGCLEALCSGTALERDATELGHDRPDSRFAAALADDGRVSGRETVAIAEEGDPDALALFERLGRNLGVGIASMINAFEPERLVIGGGLSRAAGLFFDSARAEAASRALPTLFERVEIDLAQGGADAGVIGAGLLGQQELARSGDTALRDTTT
jgi:glucokinase